MIDPTNLTATARLTFSEDFNTLKIWDGTSGLDPTANVLAPLGSGNPGIGGYANNGEKQWYVNPEYQPSNGAPALPNPFSISNGILTIHAAPAADIIKPTIGGQDYTSGVLSTYHEFSQTYGYFEMRAQLPAGNGLWPAFWLLPADGTWPPEIDVMEQLGRDPTTIYTSIHTSASGASQTGAESVGNTSLSFHTYGVDWEPDTITWYFDGQKIYQTATPADADAPMYMIANLAVGGHWPGNPDSSTPFPADMKIDYLRAYAAAPLPPVTQAPSIVDVPVATTPPAGAQDSTAAPGPTVVFASTGYLAANPDVAKAKIDPNIHFDQYGWKEGRDPSANFDAQLYLAHNPDVKAAGMDPLAHYVLYGQAEGRTTYAAIGSSGSFNHGSFDAEYYLLANADVAKAALEAGGDTLAFAYQHYSEHGWHEGRNPNAVFDVAFYLAHNPDVAAAQIDPLSHFDTFGWQEGRNASAQFNASAYLAANPDVAAAHIDPLTHYLRFGAMEDRHMA